jgi:Nucleotidyl transferase AbiEii toxin, Type IV TA system
VQVLGYPIETVLAEKISTAIALGEANTRVRDYADLHILTGKHIVAFTTMWAALQATTGHRGVSIKPLSEVVGEIATLRQDAYEAFRRRLGPDGIQLPGSFSDVVADAIRFIDPITNTKRSKMTWNPTTREWQ